MSVYQKRPGGPYYMDFVFQGIRVAKSCFTKDRQKAEDIEEAEKHKLLDELSMSPEERAQKITLLEAIDRGFEERWHKTRTGEITRKRLQLCANILGNGLLSEIKPQSINTIKQTLTKMGRTDATINRYLANMKTLLFMAELDWGLPLKRFRIRLEQEDEGRMRVISPEEEAQVITILRNGPAKRKADSVTLWEGVADLVPFLIDTGLRVGEALKLTCPKNIDLKERLIILTRRMTKTKRSRIVPLSDQAYQILYNRCVTKGMDRPFPFKRTSVVQLFQNVRKKMGLEHDEEFVLHACRHTCASRLVRAGVDLYRVRDILGHTSITTTERYAKLNVESLREAIQEVHSGDHVVSGMSGGTRGNNVIQLRG